VRNEANLNDSDLVDGLRCHNPAAVKHLSDCYLPSVWRFVYVRVKGDRHLAEDIVSEAVLALIRAVSDPKLEIGNPVAWLRSVASNKVADHFRAAARVQHLIDQARHTEPVRNNDDAVHVQELQEQREEIRQVLDRLPEPTRMALEWKYIDKLSVKEISERLHVSEKAAESILFRGRKEFRQRMLMKAGQDDSSASVTLARGECDQMNGRTVKKQVVTDEMSSEARP
jgi:RNA polymerase sigma factor (sigma-70 family)